MILHLINEFLSIRYMRIMPMIITLCVHRHKAGAHVKKDFDCWAALNILDHIVTCFLTLHGSFHPAQQYQFVGGSQKIVH